MEGALEVASAAAGASQQRLPGFGTGATCEPRHHRSALAQRGRRADHGALPDGAAVKAIWTTQSPRRQHGPFCGNCRGSWTGATCEARGNRSAPARRAQRAGHGAPPEGAAVKADRISRSLRRLREPACGSCRGSRTDAKCEARGKRSAPARRRQRAGHSASPDGAAAGAGRTSRSLRRQREPAGDSYRGPGLA
jgi:hypothetical protein